MSWHSKRSAFTMIELVFVIVVLGILAAVAIPKFAATRDDAKFSRAKAILASGRSGLASHRMTRMLQGQANCADLTDWKDVLTYTPPANWNKLGGTTCTITFDNTACTLTASGGGDCSKLNN